MKKIFALVLLVSVFLSACTPAIFTSAGNLTPLSEEDLRATAAILSQQTLQAILPTETAVPSKTPVVKTPTATPIQSTPTETQNPVLLTLTATLGTGTVEPGTEAAAMTAAVIAGTLPLTASPAATSNSSATTPHPQFYGTLPPDLPYGSIFLVNKAQVEVYISLRCVTKDDYVTILEYPVKKSIRAKAPAGSYTYVAWVGGREFTGSFSLSAEQDLTINFFKNRIAIK
ncbi:MAG: hypothetical protein IH589_05850 [Anaerolineales bacterium]|nr:hypothetical protein [Anaerolineales bacterium]